jgi:hydroxylamine reductase (hybrid-cluster protein)
MSKKPIPEELVEAVRNWMGRGGIEFFTSCHEEYGTVSPVYMDPNCLYPILPHSVHFNEGMQVRNFMRTTEYCTDWNSHDLDDNWEEVIERAIGVK